MEFLDHSRRVSGHTTLGGMLTEKWRELRVMVGRDAKRIGRRERARRSLLGCQAATTEEQIDPSPCEDFLEAEILHIDGPLSFESK